MPYAINNLRKERGSWYAALHRCNNPKSKAYKHYGGRGIKVKFATFEDFFSHLGPCPEGLSLDRINNDGHYEPGNVRWADRLVQMNNRTFCRKLTYKGQTKTISEWSRETGLTLSTLYQRVRKWESIEQILETPHLSCYEGGKRAAEKRWGKHHGPVAG
jgi:hypothetical protein